MSSSILYEPPYKGRNWQSKKTVLEDGTITYSALGKYHRMRGAAVIRRKEVAKLNLEPVKEYYRRGELHSQDYPARIWEEGLIEEPDTYLFLELPENTYLEDAAILLAHLKEEWFFHGMRHREDGPAIVAGDEEQYWRNGKLHREDGPAVIRHPDLAYLKPRHFKREGQCLALKEYWKEGVLLRRLLMNGTEEWFYRGQHHRLDAPAVTRTSRYVKSDRAQKTGEDAVFEYRKRGILHREDGPALMRWDAERDCFHYQWFIDGRLENSKGPAELWLNGDKIWYENGEPHREDGPAIVFSDGREFWMRHGDKDRKDGPAVISEEKREYWEKGKLHRADGPAIKDKNKEVYYKNGKRHRIDGPALIAYGEYHEWYEDDLLHRAKLPAVWRDTSFALEKDLAGEEYWQRGKLYRKNGPAIIYPDGSQMYYQEGKLHREDGPAIIRSRERALREREPLLEYYQNGVRERIEGPAVIWSGGKEEYWRDGVKFASPMAITQYSVLPTHQENCS